MMWWSILFRRTAVIVAIAVVVVLLFALGWLILPAAAPETVPWGLAPLGERE